MAVNHRLTPSFREWGGESDRRLPIGQWRAAGAVFGNATGGSVTITILFQPSTASARLSNLYSLEQLSMSRAESVTSNAGLRAQNLEDASHGLAYALTLGPIAGTSLAATVLTEKELPLFLGGAAASGVDVGLELVSANTNGVLVTVIAEGYYWGARSRSVLGGPRRPEGAVYG